MASLSSRTPGAEVVLSELFYRAPNDLRLEWIELHNAGEEDVDIGGWRFDGVEHVVPSGTALPAGGYLVLANDEELFRSFYRVAPTGTFRGALANGGEKLSLLDAGGAVVDSVEYSDDAPWPAMADGRSASIERICASAPGGDAANWTASPPSDDIDTQPGGTPGRRNAAHSLGLPPVLEDVSVAATAVRPGSEIAVSARVSRHGSPLRAVEVLYRTAGPGSESAEVAIPMRATEGGAFTAVVPTSESGHIVRVRVRAVDAEGGVRYAPAPTEERPALSVWVGEEIETGAIPVFAFIHVGEKEHERARTSREGRNQRPRGFPGGPFDRGPDRQGRRETDRRRSDGAPDDQRTPGPEAARDRTPREDDRPFGRGPGDPFGRGPGGPFGSRPPEPRPGPGRSAIVITDPTTKETRLFDFVHIAERKSGYKVRFHSDRPFDGMTTINVLYERDERSILNEALAYELYRRAGNETQRAGYARVAIDGQVVGYHLWFEQPNAAFFRRQGREGGELYKLIWMGSHRPSAHTPEELLPRRMDIASRHEKKTRVHDGYEDLIALIETLESTRNPDELWRVIEREFDVEQVVNYFAVNSLLSHWDGFFNNYFLYRQPKSGRWQMYPWDQDSTWGHRMSRGDEIFAEMALTFGADDDVPPGGPRPERGRGGFRGFGAPGAMWWRPGGDISRPLLANPSFRRRFLARLEALATTVYTEEVFGPELDALRARLVDEVRLRARVGGRSEEDAVRDLDASLAFFREHLARRREFILRSTRGELDSKR